MEKRGGLVLKNEFRVGLGGGWSWLLLLSSSVRLLGVSSEVVDVVVDDKAIMAVVVVPWLEERGRRGCR